MRKIYIAGGIVLIVILDQIAKLAVSSNMAVGQSIPVISGLFHITYIHNTGAAFGSFSGGALVLAAITGAVMLAALIFIMVRTRELGIFVTLCIVMVLGGGIGNLIDRAYLGYVIDFLDFKIWNPVFNVADIFICVGCGLMIVYLMFFEGKKDGKRNTRNN